MVNGAPMVLSDAALNERILRNLLTDLEERLIVRLGVDGPEEITSAMSGPMAEASAAKCPRILSEEALGRW